MRQLRFWFIAIILWFFVLYNLDELSEPLNMAPFVYIFTAFCAITIILVRPLHKGRLFWSFVIALPIFFMFKAGLNYEIGGKSLPITISEISMVGITIFLAQKVARGLDELREAIQVITIDRLGKETQPFSSGQSLIYREIRRARHYQQHASLLAVKPSQQSVALTVNHFIQEAVKDIGSNYMNAQIANFLVQELNDSDIVTKGDNHIIALLSEAGKEEAHEVAARIEAAAKEKLGLSLNVGVATFPEEAVTFESLLNYAEADMEKNPVKPLPASVDINSISMANSELYTGDSSVPYQ